MVLNSGDLLAPAPLNPTAARQISKTSLEKDFICCGLIRRNIAERKADKLNRI
jgi:hypothetical protein